MNPNAVAAGRIFRERLDRLVIIQQDDEALAASFRKYKNDPVQYINDWFVTYDPREKPALMPFILWPKQVEYLLWLRERYEKKEDFLVEKSRDAGATYLNMAFSLWLWRFYPGSKIGFGSRKEMLVDRLGDPDSIFEKGRIMLRYLPNEYLPNGFDPDTHTPFLKIINPSNGNTITGEAGDNIGRGGRNSLYFKDESGHYEHAEKIDAALSMNSDVKGDISTPNGTGNPFYKKRVGGFFKVFFFDWRDDPRKDDAWYKRELDKNGPVIMAREVDRSYTESVERICIPANYVQAAVNYPIAAQGQKVAGLDVADEGDDLNALTLRQGVVLNTVESWKEGNTGETTRRAAWTLQKNDINILKYDSIGVGAGVKSEIMNWNAREKFKIRGQGVNFGAAVTDKDVIQGKKNKDMFLNLKAQLWWALRLRFEKTWETKTGKRKHPPEEMISIINHPQLILELSQQRYEFDEGSGRLRMESKKKMKARGIASPNLADSLVICFSPVIGLDLIMLTQD